MCPRCLRPRPTVVAPALVVVSPRAHPPGHGRAPPDRARGRPASTGSRRVCTNHLGSPPPPPASSALEKGWRTPTLSPRHSRRWPRARAAAWVCASAASLVEAQAQAPGATSGCPLPPPCCCGPNGCLGWILLFINSGINYYVYAGFSKKKDSGRHDQFRPKIFRKCIFRKNF